MHKCARVLQDFFYSYTRTSLQFCTVNCNSLQMLQRFQQSADVTEVPTVYRCYKGSNSLQMLQRFQQSADVTEAATVCRCVATTSYRISRILYKNKSLKEKNTKEIHLLRARALSIKIRQYLGLLNLEILSHS